LAWQAPSSTNERYRWIVAELVPGGGDLRLRYIDDLEEFKRLNGGRLPGQIQDLGYAGYPAFNQKRSVHSEGVVSALLRRLPPRSRPDFEAYKKQFRLAPDLALSDVALLAATEAKVPGDGFSVVDPLDAGASTLDLVLEVAGYRHYAHSLIPPLAVGDRIVINAELENTHDSNAVMFSKDGIKIGNINRVQAPTFRSWLRNRHIEATVERLNGRPDHPRAFIFVRVRPVTDDVSA